VSVRQELSPTKPTRNETESWLLNKLNRYVSSSTVECNRFFENNFSKPYECLTYTDIKFHLEGDNLMIDFSTNLVEYNDRAQEEFNFHRKIIIPLKDLNYLGFITTNSISFTTKYSAIRITDNPGKSSTKMFFKL